MIAWITITLCLLPLVHIWPVDSMTTKTSIRLDLNNLCFGLLDEVECVSWTFKFFFGFLFFSGNAIWILISCELSIYPCRQTSVSLFRQTWRWVVASVITVSLLFHPSQADLLLLSQVECHHVALGLYIKEFEKVEKYCKSEDDHATQTKNELERVHAQVSKAETGKKNSENFPDLLNIPPTPVHVFLRQRRRRTAPWKWRSTRTSMTLSTPRRISPRSTTTLYPRKTRNESYYIQYTSYFWEHCELFLFIKLLFIYYLFLFYGGFFFMSQLERERPLNSLFQTKKTSHFCSESEPTCCSRPGLAPAETRRGHVVGIHPRQEWNVELVNGNNC